MWRKFSDWLYMTPRERRGVGVLLVVLILLQIGISIQSHFQAKQTQHWQASILANLDVYLTKDNEHLPDNDKEAKGADESEDGPMESIYFDPNTVSKEILLKTGLSEGRAENLIAYREKGGTFYKADDLKKLYTLDNNWLERNREFMVFVDLESRKPAKTRHEGDKAIVSFDPNTLDATLAAEIGMYAWQYDKIVKYRENVDAFYTAEDLKKVYGLNEVFFEKYANHIKIDTAALPAPLLLDLNHTDDQDLQKIHGIGKVFANRILKYRDLLGGYVKTDQLIEVYGVDSVVLRKILPHIFVNTENVKRLNLNKASQADLVAHPYIDKQMAAEIIEFRENFRAFVNVEELRELTLFTDSTVKKVQPYFFIENTNQIENE